ncbi:HD domain-containing protein [Thermosipho ferrireducens]|uniref:HD domain-containing protein n=1 Tax=Thermosipho ferrireducens TaxID=2571116 RepID=A0ABX7S8Q9_9BACT|nr:HD domain-containing phosphohydrolase [Thermosipho ferrireducens]QTA37666.1 HD domain-containing protein [Thermosipho ferrireducens]
MIRWKRIEYVKPGEVVSEDVYDPSGFVILIKGGTALREGDIVLLKKRGVSHVPIEIESLDLSNPEIPSAIKPEMYFEIVEEYSSLLEEAKQGVIKLEHIVKQAEKIVSGVLENIDKQILNIFTKDDLPLVRHGINTSIISTMIGYELGFDEESLVKISTAALLHDIGYLNDILKRDIELLSDPHPIRGASLLKSRLKYNDEILLAVLHHHERYDGRGFPRGLKEETIPIYARIVAVADAYDTIISKDLPGVAGNPYKAVKWIVHSAGHYYDPNIVSVFVKYVGIYPTGTKVILSNGKKGTVIKVGKGLFPYVLVEGKVVDVVKEGITIKEIVD